MDNLFPADKFSHDEHEWDDVSWFRIRFPVSWLRNIIKFVLENDYVIQTRDVDGEWINNDDNEYEPGIRWYDLMVRHLADELEKGISAHIMLHNDDMGMMCDTIVWTIRGFCNEHEEHIRIVAI